MKRFLLILSLLMLICAFGFSQSNPSINIDHLTAESEGLNTKELRDLLKDGDSYYRKGIYDRAYRAYKRLYDVNSNLPELNYKLGISALRGNRQPESLNYFLKSSTDVAKDYFYFLGKAYQANLKYSEARDAYVEYYNSLGKWRQRKFQQEFDQLISECTFGYRAANDSLPFFIINMGPTINTYYDEYAAVEYADHNKMFFTTRSPDRLPTKPVHRSTYSERVMEAGYENGEFSEANEVSRLFSRGHASVAGINQNDDLLYVYNGRRRFGHVQAARIRNGEVRRSSRIKGGTDRKAFKKTSVSVTNNGEVFFVSDRPGGEGGKDIWVAQIKSSNRFSRPKNLGSTINTPLDEEAVYVTPDGRTLYFASNGHPGFGGFDVYKSKRASDGTWGEPVNLGYPINSPGDDMFYFPTSDPLVAFIASDRPGGFGGMDLYKVVKDTRVPFTFWGEVTDVASGEILPARTTLIDLDSNQAVAVAISDSLSGEYYFELEDVGNFALQVDVPGYRTEVDTLEMPAERHASLRKDYQLEKLLHPYTLWGNITDRANQRPLQAEIIFRSTETDSILYRVYSDANSGFYSVTFEDKMNMSMNVSAQDYFSRNIPLQANEMTGEQGERSFELVRSRTIYTVTGLVRDEQSRNPVAARFRISRPGIGERVISSRADSVTGRYEIQLDDVGPFLMEINADGYFYINTSLQFHPDSTLMVRNIEMQNMTTGARVIIENILFTTGQATLRSESYSELNKLVRLLQENPSVRIEVAGHTDNVGSAALNRRLSRDRALAVKNYLESQGIAPGRIEYQGYGFDRPIESNLTEEGRAANRRVEIEIIE
ncbi:OmpA family protein [Natronoflexus pectinivorans]|uniref:WD40 repeat protein n=1 Tax=Natronoflexus pectinivorans TaxID=682526 RepID=A0A4R2GK27_9BACT|nr:OmpA family protein [Natronoflexus pectinivorans]TCO08815.1 WD40 repeat protein [Natronoflexus pectinivorans]